MERKDYGEAFQAGYGATRRFLLALGAAVEVAEEVAQAAWVRGWEYRDQLRDPGMVGFWVNSIARNLYRARFRGPMTMQMDGVHPSYTMEMQTLELRRLLDRCTRRDRKLLERNLAGYSAEEMARESRINSREYA